MSRRTRRPLLAHQLVSRSGLDCGTRFLTFGDRLGADSTAGRSPDRCSFARSQLESCHHEELGSDARLACI